MKDRIIERSSPSSNERVSWLKERHVGFVISGIIVLALVVVCCEVAGFGCFRQNLAAQIPSSVENVSAGDAPASLSTATEYLDADTEKVVSSLEDSGFEWDDDTMIFKNDAYYDGVTNERALCEMQFSAFPGYLSAPLIQTRDQLREGTVISGVWLHMRFSDSAPFQDYAAQTAIDMASRYGLDGVLSSTSSVAAPLWLKSANIGKQVTSADVEARDTAVKGVDTYTRLDYGLACGAVRQDGYDYAWICTYYQDDASTDASANVEYMIMSQRNFETYYGVSVQDPAAAEYVAAAYLFDTHISVDFGLNR